MRRMVCISAIKLRIARINTELHEFLAKIDGWDGEGKDKKDG